VDFCSIPRKHGHLHIWHWTVWCHLNKALKEPVRRLKEDWNLSQNLIQKLEARRGAMKVTDLTELLGVDDKHIYRMAARGQLPSFRVGGAVRFDPQEVANWLRSKYGPTLQSGKKTPGRINHSFGDASSVA
jgi:excisionase family DNA binding protein